MAWLLGNSHARYAENLHGGRGQGPHRPRGKGPLRSFSQVQVSDLLAGSIGCGDSGKRDERGSVRRRQRRSRAFVCYPSFVALARFMVTAPVDVEEISADWRGDGEVDAKDFLATLSLAALMTFLRRSRSRRN